MKCLARNNFCIWNIIVWSFLLLIISGIGGSSGKAQDLTPQVSFSWQRKIANPSIVTTCGKYLWVYSVKQHSIFILSLRDGHIKKEIPIEKQEIGELVTAMDCYQGELLVATRRMLTNEHQLSLFSLRDYNSTLNQSGQDELALKRSWPTTDKKIFIRDIFCQSNGCYLVKEDLFFSSDLKTWQKIDVPPSKEVEYIKLEKQKNPFGDWQDKMRMSKGRYSRILITPQKDLLLLDPLRTSIVKYPQFSGAIIDHSLLKKWGKWGRWDGTFMYPKAMSYLSGLSLLSIIDAGLKLVFLYDLEGEVKGHISLANDHRFDYPLDQAAKGNNLYIADFLGNMVHAINIPSDLDVGEKKQIENIEELLHTNLFFHKEVIEKADEVRCLNCHDGLEVNSLQNFIDKNHHPLNVEVKWMKNELPLKNNKITCITCHKTHHKKDETIIDKKQVLYKVNLRVNILDLCQNCHQKQTVQNENHSVLTFQRKDFYYDKCLTCHSMHGVEKQLLNEGYLDLCKKCHQEDFSNHNHPLNDNVTCTSCHVFHHEGKEGLKINKDQYGFACLSCHNEFKKHLTQNSHLRPGEMTVRKELNKWPEGERGCLTCHSLKAPKKVGNAQCLECHADHELVHPISAMKGKSKPKCMECHDPHGKKGHPFLLNKDFIVFSRGAYCLGCHQKEINLMSHPVKPGSYCTDCHPMHAALNKPKSLQLKRPFIYTNCLECHQELKLHDGKNVHLTVQQIVQQKTKLSDKTGSLPNETKDLLNKTEGQNASCLQCHSPHRHKQIKKETDLCFSCHREKENAHPQLKGLLDPGTLTVEGRNTKCTTCHDPHIQSKHKKFLNMNSSLLTSQRGCAKCHLIDDVVLKSHPLNNQVKCKSCHPLHGVFELNAESSFTRFRCIYCHENIAAGLNQNKHMVIFEEDRLERIQSKDRVCIQCHSPHESKLPGRAACINCHEGFKSRHQEIIPITGTSRAKNVILEDEQITCITCHDPHGTLTEGKLFKKKKRDLLIFCASCHGDEVETLMEKFHLLINPPLFLK